MRNGQFAVRIYDPTNEAEIDSVWFLCGTWTIAHKVRLARPDGLSYEMEV